LWEIASTQPVRRIRCPNYLPSLTFSPDGALVAGGDGESVHIWDTRTGSELNCLRGPTADVLALAFAADGRKLVAGLRDTSALVFALTTTPPRSAALVPRPFADLWADLASKDAGRAYAAGWQLSDDHDKTVTRMRARLAPVTRANSDRARALIADLDNDEFAR